MNKAIGKGFIVMQILFGTGLPGAVRSTVSRSSTSALPSVGRQAESNQDKFPGVAAVYRSGEKALRRLLETTPPKSVYKVVEYLQREGTWGHGIAFDMNPAITKLSKENNTWSSYLWDLVGRDPGRNKLRVLKGIRQDAVTSHERKNEAFLRDQVKLGNQDLRSVRVAFITLNKMCEAHLPPDERVMDEKALYAKELVVRLGHVARDVLQEKGYPLLVKRDSYESMRQRFRTAAGDI